MRYYLRHVFWSFVAIFLGFLVPFFIVSYFFGGDAVLPIRDSGLASIESSTDVTAVNYDSEEPEIVIEPRYFLKNENAFPVVSAKAFLIADLDTGQIIKAENEYAKRPIASVSKLMTALVSLDVVNRYEQVEISQKAVSTYGRAGSLYVGEEILVGQLLYPLLLESSNDAAVALAEYAGESDFIRAMNSKAGSLGLSSTYFKDSSGLASQNVSTAEDLFRLAQYIYRSKRSIFNVTQKTNYDRWYNNNTFLNNKYFLGGKNGYIPEAKQTAVALFSLPLSEEKNRRVAVVLLGSGNRERDMARILGWLKSNVFYGEDPVEKQRREEITSFVFVGDIMMDRGVEKSVLENGGGHFSFLFKDTGFIKEADIAFGNLEGSVSKTGEDSGAMNSFRFHPLSLDALKEAGFNALSVANNHVVDWGREAFEESIARLKDKKIVTAGGGSNKAEATGVKIIEKNSIKVGFLGFSDVGPGWFAATEDKAGISIAGDDFASLVQEASQKVDVLVVSVHFGDEYENISNDRQKYLARLAIDSGAKIVVGHHPHVVQEVENYKGGVIAYSLGNFIFDQNFSEDTMTGMALEVYMQGGDIMAVKQNKIKINKFFQPELVE